MRTGAEKLGLPLPRYTWDDPYLVLTIFRNPEAAARALKSDVLTSLSKAEQKGWQWIVMQDSITAQEYTNAMGIPKRTALNHLKHFTELDLIQRTGSGPATRYKVSSP